MQKQAIRGKNRTMCPLVSCPNLLLRAFPLSIRYRLHNDTGKIVAKSPPAAAHCVKRRKTTGENSIPRPIDYSLRTSVSEGPIPDVNTSRTTARRRDASVELFSENTSTNPVGRRASQLVRSGTSDQNSVSSSTDIAPENGRDPITPFTQAQMVRTTDLAVPVTEEVSESFTRASTPGFHMKMVQVVRKREPNTPLISTPDNPSVTEAFSPPPASPRRDAAVLSSTTFDGHGRSRFESLENSPHLSPADGNPKITLTAGVHPSVVAPSSPRLSGASHEAGCIEENPVPRTPAGFNTPAHPDVSNITSPGDTVSVQFRHGSRGSYVCSTVAHPSSSSMLVAKERKTRKTVNSNRRSGKASSSGSSSKQVKDKPKLITPLEYAQRLQSSLDLNVKLKTNYLKGKHIFYVGGDMMYAGSTTRGRMEYVSHLCVLLLTTLPSEMFRLWPYTLRVCECGTTWRGPSPSLCRTFDVDLGIASVMY